MIFLYYCYNKIFFLRDRTSSLRVKAAFRCFSHLTAIIISLTFLNTAKSGKFREIEFSLISDQRINELFERRNFEQWE